jgi:3-hydroxyacyl-CoA dehydrogenase/enoyl-CoA hydratase/3-hydroxybutyryl-CoA epimerase
VKQVEGRRLGRKSGEGFYVWRDGKVVRAPTQPTQVPADLEDRLILPMLNEAVAALREGVIEDADLLDAGAIFATGFAPFRGGPLQYAKSRGISRIVDRLTELSARHGERFRPDTGWSRLVGEDPRSL